MAPPEGVHTYAGRLATFEGPRRPVKRRASAAKKKSTASVAWPHTTPTPEQLAKAGFFYEPSSESDDNVKCFVCGHNLDGWEATDVPAEEHLAHSGECGWAINAVINHRVSNSRPVEEDPLSECLLEARRATFKDCWPHEDKRGWKCKVTKMIEAGWCYDPTPETDDEVQCVYCNLRLDGWEPKDNPMEEHRKRSAGCHFFALVEQFAGTRKKKGGKGSRSSKASAKSRTSTQSNTTVVEIPSIIELSNTALDDDDDTIMTTATNATTKSTASKRGKSKAKAAPKAPRKTAKSKKAAASEMDKDEPQPVDTTAMADEQPAAPLRATRGRKRNTTQNQDTTMDSTLDSVVAPKKVSRAKTIKKPVAERLSADESQLQAELLDAVRRASTGSGIQSLAGTKRTSDGVAKVDSSIVVLEDPPSPPKAPAAKKARAKKGTTKKASKPEEVQSSQVDIDMSEAPSLTSKPVRKPRGRAAAKPKSPTPEPVAEPNYEDDFDDEMELHDTNLDVFPEPPSVAKEKVSTPLRTMSSAAQKKMTPSPSPQSSDAENVPPSARPSTHPASIQRQMPRVPLGTLASTPTVSPSKRNIINGGLSSRSPWDAIDLETVFLMAQDEEKEFRRLHGLSDGDNNENFNYDDPQSRAQATERVKASLSSPEKKMTVEQWIKHNALKGEERLKAECERMVSIFETEGMRALRAIEGIECVP